MTSSPSLGRRLRAGIGRVVRGFSPRVRLERALSGYLPEAVCVDVGASYFPHGKWHLFLASPATRWVAVEPNKANLGYLQHWRWPSRVSSFPTGLSKEGGTQTLYVTNVDSGSSLLEPHVPPAMSRRFRQLDYFFPVTPRQIETRTLPEVLADQPANAPTFVKLDTQGTELSILSGAEEHIRARRIVGIEMEATLLSEPLMRGAGKFWHACQYLENLGLELLLVHPIYGPSRLGVAQPRGLTFINECDAVFAVRQDIAAELPVEHRVALFTFYLCNRLFEEAYLLLTEDASVSGYLSGRGCAVDSLGALIRTMA